MPAEPTQGQSGIDRVLFASFRTRRNLRQPVGTQLKRYDHPKKTAESSGTHMDSIGVVTEAMECTAEVRRSWMHLLIPGVFLGNQSMPSRSGKRNLYLLGIPGPNQDPDGTARTVLVSLRGTLVPHWIPRGTRDDALLSLWNLRVLSEYIMRTQVPSSIS